jgi:hypothetical protein
MSYRNPPRDNIRALAARVGQSSRVTVEVLLVAPYFLIGSIEQMAEDLGRCVSGAAFPLSRCSPTNDRIN